MSDRLNFELTTSPVAALRGTLVVGCKRLDDGDVKLYLDHRSRGLYVQLPAGEVADAAERTWNVMTQAHLFLTPIPPPECVFLDGNRVTPGTEKCQCGPDCLFPCWQRLGLTTDPCCKTCPPLPEEDE